MKYPPLKSFLDSMWNDFREDFYERKNVGDSGFRRKRFISKENYRQNLHGCDAGKIMIYPMIKGINRNNRWGSYTPPVVIP